MVLLHTLNMHGDGVSMTRGSIDLFCVPVPVLTISLEDTERTVTCFSDIHFLPHVSHLRICYKKCNALQATAQYGEYNKYQVNQDIRPCRNFYRLYGSHCPNLIHTTYHTFLDN